MRRVFLPLLVAASCVAAAQPKFTHPDRIRYDGQCFTIDGKDTFLFSGAFHYFRCPKALWRERFQAIKDAGFNAVETYVAWNWSERSRPSGPDDYSKVDLRDLDEWLSMAENEFGLYTIVRPGPYICAEWATGGFPNWLVTYRPATPKRKAWYRSDDPVFEVWSRHWFKAVSDVVRKHQITHKPKGQKGVILWQVENEYDFFSLPEDAKRNYVKDLIRTSIADGIDVPIFGCWTGVIRNPKGDSLLSQAFDNPNQYPRWDIDSVRWATDDQHRAQPWAPKMVTEFQGGWFGQVGGQAAEEQEGIDQRQIKALTLYAIQNGLTGLNYYMLFGGTNLGDWAAEGITTSYDYFAPVREWGGRGDKYRAVQAVGRMLQQYGQDLARSVAVEPPLKSDSPQVSVAARKGTSGATYLFVHNTSHTDETRGSLGGVLPYSLGSFGMEVYRYMGAPADGKWITNEAPAPREALAAPVRLSRAEVVEVTPTGWRKAPQSATNDRLGVWDSRLLFYRATAAVAGKLLWIRSINGELITTEPPAKRVAGGDVWPSGRSAQVFAFLNPGWPNGGVAMESARGVQDALLLSELPSGSVAGGWKGKVLTDPSDRTLVGPGVDTSGWVDGAPDTLFQPHTTAIVRTTVDLGSKVDPATVLSTEGVDDEGWFYVNGHFVGEIHEWGVPTSFPVGKYLHPGANDIAIVIKNNEGAGGLTGAVAFRAPLSKSLPFAWEWTDRLAAGKPRHYDLDTSRPLSRNEHPTLSGSRKIHNALVVRSLVRFANPGKGAWEILIEAGGDGFLKLNGNPLGRYWEVGPQRGYYLPASMLRAHNVLELTAIPGRTGDRIRAAELRQLPMH